MLEKAFDTEAKMSHLKRTIDSDDEDEVVVQMRNNSKARATGKTGPRESSEAKIKLLNVNIELGKKKQ